MGGQAAIVSWLIWIRLFAPVQGRKELALSQLGVRLEMQLALLAIPGTLQSIFVALRRGVQVLSVMIASGDTELA